MEVYSFSAKGSREKNEDFILSQQLSPECSLFLVADGMGGYSFGDVAAYSACTSIAETLSTNFGKSEIKKLISISLNIANEKIYALREQYASKMGTTIGGAVIEGKKAYLFWLGDVRIYQFRAETIIYQSKDHSLLNEMKGKRAITMKEIERYGNIVTQSLTGNSFEKEFSIIEVNLMSQDVLIICTDGLWRNVPIPSIRSLADGLIGDQLKIFENSMDDNYSLLKISI